MDTCHRDSEERDAQCHPSSGVSCLLECGRDEDHVCPQKRSAKTLARVHPGHRPRATALRPPRPGLQLSPACPEPSLPLPGFFPVGPVCSQTPFPTLVPDETQRRPWSGTRRSNRDVQSDAS